jgi:hypothetical protein
LESNSEIVCKTAIDIVKNQFYRLKIICTPFWLKLLDYGKKFTNLKTLVATFDKLPNVVPMQRQNQLADEKNLWEIACDFLSEATRQRTNWISCHGHTNWISWQILQEAFECFPFFSLSVDQTQILKNEIVPCVLECTRECIDVR